MDFQEVGWEGAGCLDLAQGRGMSSAVVNTVMNTWVS
jgi:hypothetical protein